MEDDGAGSGGAGSAGFLEETSVMCVEEQVTLVR